MIATIPRATGPVFMFCVPGLIFGGNQGVGSRFHTLRFRTHFLRYRGCSILFSCFARPDSFSTIPRASGPVFMFCAPGLVFGGSEGAGSRFNVLRSRTRFRQCRVRWVPFSCFARPHSFSKVPWASCPVFMFSATGLVVGGAECVGSRFYVLSAGTRF
jgi:hypothetical protein